MITQPFSLTCLCAECQRIVFESLAPSALGQKQYAHEQRRRAEVKKLQSWNKLVKEGKKA